MRVRHFLSIADLGPQTIFNLVEQSLRMARRPLGRPPLADCIVGMYFRKSSTRTRTAFTTGALRLGAQTIAYGPNDLQLVTGETFTDTGRVLSGFLDVLVVRTNDNLEEMEALAQQQDMAIINAMSENEHPTQAIADLTTIREELGCLENVNVLYIGEGNNTAAAFALAVAQLPGMSLTIMTPEGYGMSPCVMEKASALAARYGGRIEQHHDLDRLVNIYDAVYTTRWETMGVPKTDPNWRSKFKPYQVTPKVIERVSRSARTIFLHDLPAMRGSEVVDEVLDGARSRAFQQARHKLTSAMAVLTWCLRRDQAPTKKGSRDYSKKYLPCR
jgi:ornithine carbamoyltransferase